MCLPNPRAHTQVRPYIIMYNQGRSANIDCLWAHTQARPCIIMPDASEILLFRQPPMRGFPCQKGEPDLLIPFRILIRCKDTLKL